MKAARDIIKKLKLRPHPEGGYYKEVYRSDMQLQSPAANAKRNALTCIYFLLEKGQVSRFHRVKHDEVWNFYLGDPLRLIELSATNKKIIRLGQTQNPPCFQHTIQANNWQAAETTGEYSLVGCSVAPAFDFDDFSFMDEQEQQELIQQHPDLQRFSL